MTYTSLAFSGFVIILLIIYYLARKIQGGAYQWIILLGGSCFFYVYNSYQYSAFILFTIASIYLAAKAIQNISDTTSKTVKENKGIWESDQKKAYKKSQNSKKQLILAITLIANFGILFLLKYFNALSGGLYSIFSLSGEPPKIGLLLPLGISFYTFQSTGYLIDVYRENAEAEKNPLKLALFISFFPQIVQGPIGAFDELHHQLVDTHDLKWENIKYGFELVVWGLFKKMIVADRALLIITAFNTNGGTEKYPHEGPYGGTAVLFVAIIYAIQLYADFSGGIDVSRGVARLFGINMGINFRQPYFATSLNDYWRRWHISLGGWMKKYVFYTLATSSPFLKMGKRFGMGLASFIVFLLVGIWHGSNAKYLAFGVWNGAVIMISILLEPELIKLRDALHIKAEALWYRVFQMARTFVLVLIGYYFDIAANLKDALDMLRRTLTDQSVSVFMSEWRSLGMRKLEYLILIAGVMVIFYFSVRLEQEKLETPVDLLEKRAGIVQWIVLTVTIIWIILMGIYGPGYNSADFVYMQF